MVSQRPTYSVTNYKKLTFDVEFGMSRLINKEIQGLNNLESLKKELFYNAPDFDIKEAFFNIDRKNTGFITFDNLEEFFMQKGQGFSQEQIVNLLKRMDRNDDGKVNFEEFRYNLFPVDGVYNQSKRYDYEEDGYFSKSNENVLY